MQAVEHVSLRVLELHRFISRRGAGLEKRVERSSHLHEPQVSNTTKHAFDHAPSILLQPLACWRHQHSHSFTEDLIGGYNSRSVASLERVLHQDLSRSLITTTIIRCMSEIEKLYLPGTSL